MLIQGSPEVLHPVGLGGLSAAAVSDADIANYVGNVLANNDMTDAEKAVEIAEAADKYGVTNADISRATGYEINQVNEYLYDAQKTAGKKLTASGVTYNRVKNKVTRILKSSSTDSAKAAQIKNFMSDYKITIAEVSAATGYTKNQIETFLQSDSTTVTPTTSLTKEQLAQMAQAEADAKIKAAQDAIAAANAAKAAQAADAAAKAAEAAAAIKAAQDAKAAANAATAAATGAVTTTSTTSTGTTMEKALPLVLAAAAAYFLGT